jgi:hypothetical protein
MLAFTIRIPPPPPAPEDVKRLYDWECSHRSVRDPATGEFKSVYTTPQPAIGGSDGYAWGCLLEADDLRHNVCTLLDSAHMPWDESSLRHALEHVRRYPFAYAELQGDFDNVPAKLEVDTEESTMPAAAQPMPLPGNFVARTDTDWAEVDRYSTPAPMCSDNVRVFLRRVDTELRFNAWQERIEIRQGYAPWSALIDSHIDELMTTAANAVHRFRPSEALFRRALSKLARERAVDPALLRLDALEAAWDGEPRLSTWLAKACGTECDPYHQIVGAILIGSMVRRIRNPGAKQDEMVVFVSEVQGYGKSTAAEIIALEREWFIDSVPLGLEPRELLPLLRGKAVVEISEMRSRGEVDAVKAMLSRTTDEARVSYAREPTRRPRRNIFIGSTNELEMLDDATGNRRFLPVRVQGEIDLVWLRDNIGQIVGEACVKESAGETFRLPRELWADAARRQEESRALADYEELLLNLFAPERGPLVIKAADLQKRLHNYVGKSVSSKAYGKVMRKLGFVRVHDDFTYGDRKVAERVWRRGTKEEAILLPQMTPLPPLPQLKPN